MLCIYLTKDKFGIFWTYQTLNFIWDQTNAKKILPRSEQQNVNEIFFSEKMGPSLQGKVCLVTGAARGIGRGKAAI